MAGTLFVDEAGDPGIVFREDRKHSSSEMLILAGAYFKSRSAYALWCSSHHDWIRNRREFKYEKATTKASVSFAHKALETEDWWWYAIACHKEQLWAEWRPEVLYRKLAGYMLEGIVSEDAGKGNAVVFDDRDFPPLAREHLEKAMCGPIEVEPPWSPGGQSFDSGFIEDVRFMASEASPGVQLADLIAGACFDRFRKWRSRDPVVHTVLSARGYCRIWPRG